jgi:hypothetical protein
MARTRYSIPLKIIDGNYFPDVEEGLDYFVRHFDTGGMTCKIEVEDTETISNGTEISEATWNDSEA